MINGIGVNDWGLFCELSQRGAVLRDVQVHAQLHHLDVLLYGHGSETSVLRKGGTLLLSEDGRRLQGEVVNFARREFSGVHA